MTPITVRVELASTGPRGYDVEVGVALGRAAEICSETVDVSRWAVIADAAVAELHGPLLVAALEAAGINALWLRVEPGEASKCRATVAELQDALIDAGIRRDGGLLAFGGGVVGDLAGFVAATLYRGIPCLQLPTTLLAMVDSSVGGKTGIDVGGGKNLVGAFHQPAGVVIDVDVLATLPESELQAGLAEVIKYGVIGDEQLFVDLEDGMLESCLACVPDALMSIVERCVRQKAGVVAGDEREANRRQVLNFGHTVGHALEAQFGYGIRHGEAVAIGMVAEARLAERRPGAEAGMSTRVAELCVRAGLPTAIPKECDPASLLDAARRDKKTRGDVIRCSLPLAIGVMARDDAGIWSLPVGDAEMIEALSAS